ncbi:MAG: hypothetical protein AB1659_06490, partial [Thermodesulfobacteriota bacterium]
TRLADYLSHRNILIRNCKNFKGLSDQYVRISMKENNTNRVCAENIRTFLNQIHDPGKEQR